jgi:very-short-patch-repair endonuclease
MAETFAQYLDKWLKQSTAQGLNNPLVKMPVKRFRPLDPTETASIANGGSLLLGTASDPIARNLYKNFQTRIRERGEHCAFVCTGAIEMTIAGGIGQQARTALFPVCLKRASLQTTGDKIKATVSDEEAWRFNPVLDANLRALGIKAAATIAEDPTKAINWVKAQLGNRASRVTADSYVGLFSSQQMVVQERLAEPPLRQALARNPVVQAKVQGTKLTAAVPSEITDDELEELGLVLPCDDSQLRVVQLATAGCCLQVEGPPGTGKSQTIANTIGNALYHGKNVLLVCDKKAAIVQVAERLSNCGLKPAMLNLHDEDLDKREFLKQATDRFEPGPEAWIYPFNELRQTRKDLNERVKFGRAIAHPSLQVTKREALGGMIQLRKELRNVPNVQIANWQSLSKERLGKLMGCLGEWPALAEVLQNATNVWNTARVEVFDETPNAANEVQTLAQRVLAQFESLQTLREAAVGVGIELPLSSDEDASRILALVAAVVKRPKCHPQLIGNTEISPAELIRLQNQWRRRQGIIDARHPVPLGTVFPDTAHAEARSLLKAEAVRSWQDLSSRHQQHKAGATELRTVQDRYLRLCEQIGFIYSPLLKVRRAQLQAALALGKFGGLVPRTWWGASTNPVLEVNGWAAKLKACMTQAKGAPTPVHFIALERVSPTHWEHVEAMAEHGFNLVSYCFKFVNDRKCKYALRQAYPGIPVRGFKQWHEVTLHAVASQGSVKNVRAAAEAHSILKELTENYLSSAHQTSDGEHTFLNHADVQKLKTAASLVEQWRGRNDLFETVSAHWQTFWEAPNPSVLSEVESLLGQMDRLVLPDARSDNFEEAITFHSEAASRIEQFLSAYEQREGDREKDVLAALAAQKDYAECQERLAPLTKYVDLEKSDPAAPNWFRLTELIEWRDLFEQLRGSQKLDIDSPSWTKLKQLLETHLAFMSECRNEMAQYFDNALPGTGDFATITELLSEMLGELPRHPLWLEKKRWQKKIPAFPEIKALWERIVAGKEQPGNAQRLFCFNLLRLCDPIAKPHGPELKQTLHSFSTQDENLATWILDHLKARLRKTMNDAAQNCANSSAELRRLAGLQRVRGTVRELVNANLGYLLDAKPCWLMSPTSLANLIDSGVFDEHGVPFDLVVFDEASQIRVLDGLLSMAFGKQVIIVGDKNQLPPTDFFASFANPEADADPQDFGISESLLDEYSGVFEDDKTHVMLVSHYRSETPDLIRFSNDWFYGGRLEMYPPAHISGIGRRLHYVPNAVYAETPGQRSNRLEAKAVLNLIELHVKECPNKSLGVVTMNIPQMELIDEQLQFFTNEDVRAFCADESRFFLRNLETVQGDEMDRIILSLTYGKNPAGQFSAAVLGPLTKSGGERRLNVAITRSRSGMVVVSSLTAADLQSSGAQSKGFQCLKALLHDLENTQNIRDYGITSKRFSKKKDGVSNVVFCDSPFEEQVVEFLENEGYEIECQYGAGRFWLDIVVKERGRNILAIECDGAAYHSSLVARTRDRARQKILEGLGWRVHRVWSTNWWFFEQQEKEAIIAAINSAREAANKAAKKS